MLGKQTASRCDIGTGERGGGILGRAQTEVCHMTLLLYRVHLTQLRAGNEAGAGESARPQCLHETNNTIVNNQ